MLKGHVIELVFTTVNGGRPSTDLSVMREDIAALLPAAVNYAITGDYWANIQRDNDREIPNSFVAELISGPVQTDQFGREYIDFDKKIINIPGNGGVRYVQDQCGNIYSPRAVGVSKKNYWDNALEYMQEFQLKPNDKKMFLFNRPDLSEPFLVGYVADVSSLEDDDELPIPAGMEPQVIDLLTGFFTNQRMQPKDYIIDGVDPVNSQQ